MLFLRFKCLYRNRGRTLVTYSTLSAYINLFLPIWRQSNRALLLAAFLCSRVPAQANIFDPLLRVLIPSYQSDNSSNQATDHSNDDGTDEDIIDADGADDDSLDNSDTKQINTESTDTNVSTEQLTTTDAESLSPVAEIDSPIYDRQSISNQGLKHNSRKKRPIDPQRPASPFVTPDNIAKEPSLYALLDAEFAIDRGEIERGIKIYKQQAFRQDATPVFERALALSLSFDDTQSSLQFATDWQQLHPDHVPAWFYVAHLALKAHDYELAGETLNRILRYDPRADLSEILIGIYPTKEQDQRDLLATLQPLDSTHNASLSVLKAGLLLKFNEPKAALLHVDQALKLQANNVPVITLKADILRKLVSPDEVLAYIEQARLRLPNRKGLYLYEIRYRLENEQSRPAWQLLLEAHKRFKSDAEITLLAALVSLDIEEYQQANQLLNALANNPQYLDQAYYYLGISAERQHRFNNAKDYFNAVMQEDLVLAARKKVVAFELIDNNVDDAIATLRKLRQQFEVFAPDSYIMQADILRQQGSVEKALELLTRASQRYPDNEALLFARAQLLDNQDDFIVKRTLLKHLLSLDPEDLSYQLSYAELLLSNDPNSELGLALTGAIIDMPYDDPRYNRERHLDALNLLASSALANKQYAKVIDYLRTPYQVLPTLRSGVLLLRAYQGLGNEQEVAILLEDLQHRFAFGQQNIDDSIQLY